MNNINYVKSNIIKSCFDFSRLDGKLQYSGSCNISVSAQPPKNERPNNKDFKCIASLSIGDDESTIKIEMAFGFLFHIDGDIDFDTLSDDIESICVPKILSQISDYFRELTKIHLGASLELPLDL